MKKPFKTIGLVITVLIILGIVARIATRGKGATEESIADIQKRDGVPVRVETVSPTLLARTLSFSGTLEGEEQAVVVARIMETVTDVPVRVGQKIGRGNVVAKLGETNPQAAYQQARFTMNNSKTDLERMEALFAQGAVSKQAVDQARLAYNLAQSAFNASRELVELRSPIDGEVVRVHVQPGDVVSPGNPVITVAKSRRIRVRFDVSASEQEQIHKGLDALIYASMGDTAKIRAVVDKVEDAADPGTRLFEVTVVSDNPEGVLRPGVLTTVDIVVEERDHVLTINNEALIPDAAGKSHVFVVGESNAAVKRDVTLGLSTGGRSEVLTGLQAGDRVVVYGQNRLVDGDPVKEIAG